MPRRWKGSCLLLPRYGGPKRVFWLLSAACGNVVSAWPASESSTNFLALTQLPLHTFCTLHHSVPLCPAPAARHAGFSTPGPSRLLACS